jgi:hypothetical protein
MSLRLGQEIQEVPWGERLDGGRFRSPRPAEAARGLSLTRLR